MSHTSRSLPVSWCDSEFVPACVSPVLRTWCRPILLSSYTRPARLLTCNVCNDINTTVCIIGHQGCWGTKGGTLTQTCSEHWANSACRQGRFGWSSTSHSGCRVTFPAVSLGRGWFGRSLDLHNLTLLQSVTSDYENIEFRFGTFISLIMRQNRVRIRQGSSNFLVQDLLVRHRLSYVLCWSLARGSIYNVLKSNPCLSAPRRSSRKI